MKNKKDSFRGNNITPAFIEAFKASKFYTEGYLKHKDELIIGVRDGYINLYHNCGNIAKINSGERKMKGHITEFYTQNGKTALSEDEFIELYDKIIERSESRNQFEKQAQERLYIDNNRNPESNWFCIDVEYTKSMNNSLTGTNELANWRFDLIAVSKSAPHRVALIELKYGKKAIGGDSGIRKHVRDFYTFFKNNFFTILLLEIVSIIHKLGDLGVQLPGSLQQVEAKDFLSEPEFYFITLNNNPETENGSTPQMSMNGLLFTDKRWGTRKHSSEVKNGSDYWTLIENDPDFKSTFLFSKTTLPQLGINDIIEDKGYDRYVIKE